MGEVHGENNWNTSDIVAELGTSTQRIDHFVFLNLKARKKPRDAELAANYNFMTNRIGLKCESVDIQTARTVPSFPIPGSGIITGESIALAIDLGMATKTITMNGVITDQDVNKVFDSFLNEDTEPKTVNVKMTAFEIAQLIHSYVDSSGFQSQQNLDEIFILIPSRVDHTWQYHTGLPERVLSDAGTAITSYTSIEDLPLIPFNYTVRNQDNQGTIWATIPGNQTFPNPISSEVIGEENTKGMGGFITSFGTQITPGQPFITFNMSFTVAFNLF